MAGATGLADIKLRLDAAMRKQDIPQFKQLLQDLQNGKLLKITS